MLEIHGPPSSSTKPVKDYHLCSAVAWSNTHGRGSGKWAEPTGLGPKRLWCDDWGYTCAIWSLVAPGEGGRNLRHCRRFGIHGAERGRRLYLLLLFRKSTRRGGLQLGLLGPHWAPGLWNPLHGAKGVGDYLGHLLGPGCFLIFRE